MSEFVCACASEFCAANGCQRLRELQRKTTFTDGTFTPGYAPNLYPGKPVGAGDGCGTSIPRYLTEDEVRRVVRDEIARAHKAAEERANQAGSATGAQQ